MYTLTDEQKSFLDAKGNIVLHACPGSGKTFIVAQKMMQYLRGWTRSHQGMAVFSFTNVASEEIQKQVTELVSGAIKIDYPHFVGTLDSFINTFLILRFGYLILESRLRPMIAFNDLYSLPFRYWKSDCYKNGCVEGIDSFRWDMNGILLRGNEPVKCKGGEYGLPCQQYKTMLLKKGLIFQSEVSGFAYRLLKAYPQIAQAIATRFPVIILDEAQDTSVEQMAVLDLINQAGTESMFLVGDPDQSIYEWRDAAPECFIAKMKSKEWETFPLTTNFRSSQNICDATHVFAKSLEAQGPSVSQSSYADYPQKPILLLYSGSIEDCMESLINIFLEMCEINNIAASPENIAVVTRRKIHSDTDISNLWKSHEVEFLAQAAYEWFNGSRKKAYEYCEKALFSLLIKEYKDIEVSIENDVEEKIPYEFWYFVVIEVLTNLPNIDQSIDSWIKQILEILKEILVRMHISIRPNLKITDKIKIKSKDKLVPHFKAIPLRNFFENKSKSNYTLSSIHGVKGETYDALMLIVESLRGRTLTPAFLNEKDIDQELMRIAYVAMTRPRKLLLVAMPKVKSRSVYPRFPKDKWDYMMI